MCSITLIPGFALSGKKSGKTYFFKVRELSGNFEIDQVLKIKQEVREKSGNFEIKSF